MTYKDHSGIITLLKILAYTVLVLGLIGSFILADKFGQDIHVSTSTYFSYTHTYVERNWGTTLGIFFGSFISILSVFAILYGLSVAIESIDMTYTRIVSFNDLSDDVPKAPEQKYSDDDELPPL